MNRSLPPASPSESSPLRTCVALLVIGAALPAVSIAANTGSTAATATLIASAEPGWPQFRGPRRDGVSDERGLLGTWPEAGPKLIWSVKGVGKGFSSPTFGDGRLYITGDFNADLYLLAYDLQGKLLWRAKNGDAWLNQYQGARAAVTYHSGKLYHENAHGRVACFDAATGKELWSVSLLERFGGENITWGLSECLIVDDRAVYATAGGRDALLVALDRNSGELLWKSEPLIDAGTKTIENAGYAPPILVSFAGRRLLIGCSLRHLYCADADTGKLQWTRPRPTSYSVLASSPVLVGDGVFMTAPFGPPGALHRLIAPARRGDKVGVEDAWTTTLDTCQGGLVYAAGKLLGAGYPRNAGWSALDARTGKTLYDLTDAAKGAGLYADGRLYALSVDGWMWLLEPTDTKFEIRGKFRLANARDRDAWAHPVILDGRLYLRYHDTLSCYDVRAAGAGKLSSVE